ncbi:hypothetical protein PINS_up002037 [Pythium insidiosum]|nr:hypothetical protein PINS_up002037 [Pythium insidiosum]
MQAVRRQLDQLFTAHAVIAIVSGALCFFTPHSHLSPILGDANNTHFAHEFIRLYGALTLAQGWLVWRTRLVSDALIRRTFCQAYCICFCLQSLALLRAQLSAPESHSILHWLNILILGGLGLAYGYFLVFKTIKAFELPGAGKAML